METIKGITMSGLLQVCKVRSNEIDNDYDPTNNRVYSWNVHYVVYQTTDDDGFICWDLYDCDDRGDGAQLCRFRNRQQALRICLRLGEPVEYAVGVIPQKSSVA